MSNDYENPCSRLLQVNRSSLLSNTRSEYSIAGGFRWSMHTQGVGTVLNGLPDYLIRTKSDSSTMIPRIFPFWANDVPKCKPRKWRGMREQSRFPREELLVILHRNDWCCILIHTSVMQIHAVKSARILLNFLRSSLQFCSVSGYTVDSRYHIENASYQALYQAIANLMWRKKIRFGFV